ncbi:MAG: glycine/sarcosine/betaine reductase complex component C subunit beta [Defluviitaleaceae bacterium]|nr:glycine/sarcosine/betaine reductase complex component C subunit beta [Defluviitaleaceae bacterium]
MTYPVLKGTTYALIQANDILFHQGSTQTNERRLNPQSEYFTELPKHYRSFEDAVAYPPNQVFIGNLQPKALDTIPRPWYQNPTKDAARQGKHGEIMPQDEFIGLIKAVDAFDLVLLEEAFATRIHETLKAHPVVGNWPFLDKLTKNPATIETITEQLETQGAEGLYNENTLVGCIKKAHAFDQALTAHVMYENLTSKASAALSMALLFAKTGLTPTDVDYIIECSEEACGDMNQRGGGNFAKAIGEVVGCVNATGSDTRGFCAAPVHALVQAAALVQSGVYKNVVVVAGGSSAKLGMNAKDHVKKGLPVLEDVIGAFAAHIGENDGMSPVIRTDIVGRHTVGSGASPQNVTQAIVGDPLDRAGLGIADIDTFSVEMQNPEITEPAGAGDVPKANYKMIAALGVMRKEFERTQLNEVVEKIAMPGFAPTQGHIPSGVPFLGHAADLMAIGSLNRVMIVGKGSLFLGRLTNLFDGVSFIMEKNKGLTKAAPAETVNKIRVGLTLLGSEHGEAEMLKGAEQAQAANPTLEVVVIGPACATTLPHVQCETEKDAHAQMDAMLKSGALDAAVTMHYNFPIGVSTVGRAITPGRGKSMYIANTTGTSDTQRLTALIKNTIQGIAVAKACGNPNPSVGVLNIDGARALERALETLKINGYDINLTQSAREGATMRGNDLLQGTPDIMVMDSLTGNVMMKTLSAFTTGGSYESIGDGYGPGVGQGYNQIINILSRASGAPVVAGAIAYAAACAKGELVKKVNAEFQAARKAGLDGLLVAETPKAAQEVQQAEAVTAPPEKIVTEEIAGIEILELEDAVQVLWKKGIYATSGMGCTGPIVLVATEDLAAAKDIVKEAGYI